MSVARANIPSTKDTVSLPVFQSREGFVKAEGAVTNWFVNGVSVETRKRCLYTANGTIPVADFVGGHIECQNIAGITALTTPTITQITQYLIEARLNLSTGQGGTPGGTCVPGNSPMFHTIIANYSSSATLAVTAGSGITFYPGGSTLTLPPNSSAKIECHFFDNTFIYAYATLSSIGTASPNPTPYYCGATLDSDVALAVGATVTPADYTATQVNGSNFDAATGIFTAPYAATYEFSWTVMVDTPNALLPGNFNNYIAFIELSTGEIYNSRGYQSGSEQLTVDGGGAVTARQAVQSGPTTIHVTCARTMAAAATATFKVTLENVLGANTEVDANVLGESEAGFRTFLTIQEVPASRT